ncbi:DUF2905 domain-containing protein [Namhaeicola litoreus]|uniref:DUF2905 domain-containing protein n=1 Tax=Namhaeicola litoreus TaxID=1052145 RepID=A0ABW3Y4N8_9FLAO
MYKLFVIVGIILIVIGLLLKFVPGALTWFGNLPGDIKYKNGNTQVFFPITSMIVVSIAISLILRWVRKFYS